MQHRMQSRPRAVPPLEASSKRGEPWPCGLRPDRRLQRGVASEFDPNAEDLLVATPTPFTGPKQRARKAVRPAGGWRRDLLLHRQHAVEEARLAQPGQLAQPTTQPAAQARLVQLTQWPQLTPLLQLNQRAQPTQLARAMERSAVVGWYRIHILEEPKSRRVPVSCKGEPLDPDPSYDMFYL